MTSLKVLVIEDEPLIIESVALCFELKWPGATVISATEGEKGLELSGTEFPDVIILDIGLPDIDGFEVLRRIRSVSDVPVIILTARSEGIEKVKVLEIRANDYIIKPFAPAEFLARVKAVLRRSHMSEEPNTD